MLRYLMVLLAMFLPLKVFAITAPDVIKKSQAAFLYQGKDFKARVKNGRVIEIGIDVFGPDCYACQPLYHLRKQDWNIWQLEIQKFCKNGNESVYAENALNEVSTTMELYPFDVDGRLCMEIDNEADLEKAKQLLEKP